MQGKYASLTKCPECGEDRYQKDSKGKAPRKLFKYIPLEPRIRQWFSSPISSELLQAHVAIIPRQPVNNSYIY